MQKWTRRKEMWISNQKKSILSIFTTLSGVISHARLFFTGQPRNPWQMLAEPLGSAEPRLKIIDLQLVHSYIINLQEDACGNGWKMNAFISLDHRLIHPGIFRQIVDLFHRLYSTAFVLFSSICCLV